MDTRNFCSDDKWIAKRLGVSVKKVKSTINRLIELSLVIKDKSGNFSKTYQQVNTSDDVLDTSIKKSHLHDMTIAAQKLMDLDLTLRDFTSYTMEFDLNKMEQVKTIIRKFQEDLHKLMKSDAKPTEVYKLNTYLYPVSVRKI